MNNATLAQATLLALTMQNQAFKVAPLATARMQGQVINRNIATGETVVCWMNNSGELTKVAQDVPAHYGDYFVDDNNHMYYKKGANYNESDNRLVECDAFSGDIISESEVCLSFKLSGDNQVAAYCTETDDDNETYSKWVVIYKDGTRSQEITLNEPLRTYGYTWYYHRFEFGYRNGVLAICRSDGSQDRGFNVSTHTQDGTLVKNLFGNRRVFPGGDLVCPISFSLVCVMQTAATNYANYDYEVVDYHSESGIVSKDPVEGYLSYQGTQAQWFGTDGVYCYLAVRICENTAAEGEPANYVWLDEWDILRVAIDNYNVEKVKTIEGVLTYGLRTATPFGHIVQEVTVDGTMTRTMIDITTMGDVYSSILHDLPTSLTTGNGVQENAGWIWIPGSGVWQKTPLDWLMSATGEYPRNSPWGKCGYAIGDYKVGQNGLAIVLFE